MHMLERQHRELGPSVPLKSPSPVICDVGALGQQQREDDPLSNVSRLRKLYLQFVNLAK